MGHSTQTVRRRGPTDKLVNLSTQGQGTKDRILMEARKQRKNITSKKVQLDQI